MQLILVCALILITTRGFVRTIRWRCYYDVVIFVTLDSFSVNVLEKCLKARSNALTSFSADFKEQRDLMCF